jgi:glucose-6-phosphate isomerase/transaldolase/glucose-6-phosphate isomerase
VVSGKRNKATEAGPGHPASSLTFGTLIHAQALGDQKALEDAGRQVIRLHLGEQVVANIERLTHLIEEEAV